MYNTPNLIFGQTYKENIKQQPKEHRVVQEKVNQNTVNNYMLDSFSLIFCYYFYEIFNLNRIPGCKKNKFKFFLFKKSKNYELI